MPNTRPNLIIIHEIEAPILEPFLKPFYKESASSLPSIYHKKPIKKIITNVNHLSQNLNFKLLCNHCNHPYQLQLQNGQDSMQNINSSKRDVTQRLPKQVGCCKVNCSCFSLVDYSERTNKRNDKKKNLKASKVSKRLQGLTAPSAKYLYDGLLADLETNHKIYKSGTQIKIKNKRTVSRMNDEIYRNNRIQERNSMIDAHNLSLNQSYLGGRNTAQRYNNYNPQNRHMQNLENKPNLRDSTSVRNKAAAKQDPSRSQAQRFAKKQSTIFHKSKVLQQSRHSKINKIKSFSRLSNGLFIIPQQDQYESYLQSYKPLDQHFNLRQVVRKANFHIVPGNGWVYFGQIQNSTKHGQGITVSEKQIFQGQYKNNQKITGSEKNIDGIYTGQFSQGKRNGRGRFIWNNGEIFQGNWIDGKKNGFGIWKSPKGDIYEGQWSDNRQEGKGRFFHGGSCYQGHFKNFLKHGRGEEEFPNGDRYIGQYKEGKPHGEGKYIWSNRDVYEGEFYEGSRQGKGKMLSYSTGQVYSGQFLNDMKHGKGQQKTRNGELEPVFYNEGLKYKFIKSNQTSKSSSYE